MNYYSSKTILLAEDHDDSRAFMSMMLREEGYKVIEAKNGAEAVLLAKREIPDLILTDLHMPELDGVSALKQIRRDKQLREVPILAMSGDGIRGMEFFLNIEEFGSGHIEYLTKPLNFKFMLEQIRNLLAPVTA